MRKVTFQKLLKNGSYSKLQEKWFETEEAFKKFLKSIEVDDSIVNVNF